MPRKLQLLVMLFLCFSLLVQGGSATFASQPSTTQSEDKTTYETKYKGEFVRVPPYCITINDEVIDDLSSELWKVDGSAALNLLGRCDESDIAGKWHFDVIFKYTLEGDTVDIPGVKGGLRIGMEVTMNGQKETEIKSLLPPKKDPLQAKDWKPTPKIDPTTARTSKRKDIVPQYEVEFDVDLESTARNLNGDDSINGDIYTTDFSQWARTKLNLISDGGSQKFKGKLKLVIYSKDIVGAELTVGGKAYGPFVGRFTSEKELETKRKDSGKWPIWGVWTDVNPYEPMPNLLKDLDKIKEQKEKNEQLKKINYPNGQWVLLKTGKKGQPASYQTLTVTDEDIIFEKGEMLTYPGSAMFVPSERSTYTKDLKDLVKTEQPSRYPLQITYYTNTDTLYYPGIGNMVRIRNANLLGVWSSVGQLPMPDVSKEASVPAGVWYEFVRGAGDKSIKGVSGQYQFTRLTSIPGKSIRMDKGTAIIIPMDNEEIITLTDIESETLLPDGKVDKESMDPEVLSVSDMDKDAGTVQLNMEEFTLVSSKVPLKGRWSTIKPPVEAPDIENGAFAVKDADGQVFDPPRDAQWLLFDVEKKQFTWIQYLEDQNGTLMQKGKYRSMGEDLLLLTEIKGSFYPWPGNKDVEGFRDKEYAYGEKVFQISQTMEDDEPVSLRVVQAGDFFPIPDPEKRK